MDSVHLLEMAERHVREADARVARQIELIAELERDQHFEAARRGRELLATLTDTLNIARRHLQIERGIFDRNSN